MNESATAQVVAICGSLRDVSKTRIDTEVVLEVVSAAGGNVELVNLREFDLPPQKRGTKQSPTPRRCEPRYVGRTVLLATPNYHGSYSGVLKNALDYCGRDEFEGTTVGLLEVAGERFPGPALIHLRQVARTLNVWTLLTEVAIPSSGSTFTVEGVADEDVDQRLRTLGRELVAQAPSASAAAEACADRPSA